MIPASLDCARLHTAYREGLAPGDVVREVFARIRAARDAGIFLSLVPEADAAAAAPALASFDPVAKPLWGLRFAVKDNIDVAMP
jgi:allophanate hydrolase